MRVDMPCVAPLIEAPTDVAFGVLMVTRMAGGSSKDSARSSRAWEYSVSPRCGRLPLALLALLRFVAGWRPANCK